MTLLITAVVMYATYRIVWLIGDTIITGYEAREAARDTD